MKMADITHTLIDTSRPLPLNNLIAAYAIKPNVIPSAIENVNGITKQVTTTGDASVRSRQSMLTSPDNIKIAT